MWHLVLCTFPNTQKKATFFFFFGWFRFVLLCFLGSGWEDGGGGGGFLCVFGAFFSQFLGCCLIDQISELSSAF